MAKANPRAAIAKAASSIQKRATSAAKAASEAVSDAAKVAGEAVSDAAKVAGEAASDTAKHVVDAAATGRQKVMEGIFRPVFSEQYESGELKRPKMIAIANDADRKDIEVCEGSIGWSGNAAGVEVLHLYEDAVPTSGLTFFPQALCDSVYYEDSLTPGRFINLDCYFDVLQKDRITELRRIAYELGARKCTLESIEEAKSVRMAKGGIGVKGKLGKIPVGDADGSYRATTESRKRIVFSQTFEGNAEPRRPELKWFAHDQEIEFLIATRCNGSDRNMTKDYRVELDSSSTQTMSVQLAAKLDKALGKLGAACNFSLKGEALTESRRRLVFEVEF